MRGVWLLRVGIHREGSLRTECGELQPVQRGFLKVTQVGAGLKTKWCSTLHRAGEMCVTHVGVIGISARTEPVARTSTNADCEALLRLEALRYMLCDHDIGTSTDLLRRMWTIADRRLTLEVQLCRREQECDGGQGRAGAGGRRPRTRAPLRRIWPRTLPRCSSQRCWVTLSHGESPPRSWESHALTLMKL
jgi:hypothetical protein